jgi:ankyrin repeat protein
MILDKMRDVNQPEKDGSTLLIYATKNKQMSAGKRQEIVKRLLEKGADKNLKDGKGKTALDYAKENKQAEAIELLK